MMSPFSTEKNMEDKKTCDYTDSEICVCCGAYVPEGRMVCPQCEVNAIKEGDGNGRKTGSYNMV